jgi:5-methylcytosine-specific restriction endonuclease McrA
MQYKNIEVCDFNSGSAISERVEHFLDELSARDQTIQVCMRCGSPQHEIDATFSLFGRGRRWDVSLSACPNCDLTIDMVKSFSQPVKLQ